MPEHITPIMGVTQRARLLRAVEGELAVIEIVDEFPVTAISNSEFHFSAQAQALADVLWKSLPGGTIDALLIEMLERRKSRLIVPLRKDT